MTGVTLPASMSSASTARSALLVEATKGLALLTHEDRSQCCGDDPAHAGVTAARDEDPVRRERAARGRQRVTGDVVHDHVVARPALCEVLLGVVDDVVRADRLDHLHVPRAADSGHLGAEGLGDLDGKRPHTPRRAVDEHLLPWPRPCRGRGGPGERCRRMWVRPRPARTRGSLAWARDRPPWRPHTRRTSRGTGRTPRHQAGNGSHPCRLLQRLPRNRGRRQSPSWA